MNNKNNLTAIIVGVICTIVALLCGSWYVNGVPDFMLKDYETHTITVIDNKIEDIDMVMDCLIEDKAFNGYRYTTKEVLDLEDILDDTIEDLSKLKIKIKRGTCREKDCVYEYDQIIKRMSRRIYEIEKDHRYGE